MADIVTWVVHRSPTGDTTVIAITTITQMVKTRTTHAPVHATKVAVAAAAVPSADRPIG